MARILVTGGPVHAKLDAVKIVTNRFRGGRMAQLADALVQLGHDVVYLCAPGSVEPQRCGVRHHEGFDDYAKLVPQWARENDVVVLGAAVANLLPRPTEWQLTEKFPSHNYAPGDVVNIPFEVAPRVIDEVKKANPRRTLVGFKLLSNVPRDELVRAAYGTLLGARADLVVANDTKNLDEKLLVTKERSVIPASESELPNVISDMANDQHYETVWRFEGLPAPEPLETAINAATRRYWQAIRDHGEAIERHGRMPEGYLFGCIAARVPGSESFICSERGKNNLTEWVLVRWVDHVRRTICVDNEKKRKASLNAPLLARIFAADPRVTAIVHTHAIGTSLPKLAYAPPGTVRDTMRDLDARDFEIEHHGSFFLVRW